MRKKLMLKGTVGLALAGAAMGPMALAWACTALATVDLNPGAANTGQAVAGKGYGFARAGAVKGVGTSPVEIHLQKADGPLLAVVQTAKDGSIAFNFKAPEGAPGYYTIVATQKNAEGKDVSGTPARSTLALNNPPPLAADGSNPAAFSEVHSAGQAPDGVTRIQAPSAAAGDSSAVAATPGKAPAQVLPPIQPAGARSRDILGASSRGSGGGQLGLTMAVLGGLGLLGAGGAAMVVRRNETGQRI